VARGRDLAHMNHSHVVRGCEEVIGMGRQCCAKGAPFWTTRFVELDAAPRCRTGRSWRVADRERTSSDVFLGTDIGFARTNGSAFGSPPKVTP